LYREATMPVRGAGEVRACERWSGVADGRLHVRVCRSFDILSDEEVRQGLKEYVKWPTYPQLYAKGKLIGGLDIVKELVEGGELKEALQ